MFLLIKFIVLRQRKSPDIPRVLLTADVPHFVSHFRIWEGHVFWIEPFFSNNCCLSNVSHGQNLVRWISSSRHRMVIPELMRKILQVLAIVHINIVYNILISHLVSGTKMCAFKYKYVYMYMYICIFIYIYVCVSICIYMYTPISVYIYIYIYISIYVYIYIYMYLYICTCVYMRLKS